jgi:hypothetical protein
MVEDQETTVAATTASTAHGSGIGSGTASTGIAAIAGLAPHVLHHVGLLAGVAFFAGATGTALFGVIGLALSIPLLLRLRRRFRTWWAPGIALAAMVAMFSLSALVIGPAISGE